MRMIEFFQILCQLAAQYGKRFPRVARDAAVGHEALRVEKIGIHQAGVEHSSKERNGKARFSQQAQGRLLGWKQGARIDFLAESLIILHRAL